MSRVFYDIDPTILPLIRKAARLSQEKFALKLGVSVNTVQKWEQGRCTPQGENFNNLDRWAKRYLGVGIDAVPKERVQPNLH